MNTCKTCRWHGQSKNPEPPIEGSPPVTRYENERINGAGCCCPKFYEDSGYSDAPPEGDEYFAIDHFVYSYYESGGFWTGNEFGCVHHQIEG